MEIDFILGVDQVLSKRANMEMNLFKNGEFLVVEGEMLKVDPTSKVISLTNEKYKKLINK